MNTKLILSFIGGIIVGGAAGFLGTKKFLEDKYQKKYEQDRIALEEYYHRTDEYVRYCEADDDTYEDDQNEVNPKEGIHEGTRMTQEERNKIKEKLNKNWEGTTNYASIYSVKDKSIDEVGFENVSEDVPDEDLNLANDEYAFEEHQKNKNRPPRIISQETYENLDPSVDKEILYLYAPYEDEIVADENEELIDDPGLLIGDALTKYDFVSSDEEVIFVMNYEHDTCYEIRKMSYEYFRPTEE